MFNTLANIKLPKLKFKNNPNQKILLTLLILFLFRFGNTIPITGIDQEALKRSFLQMDNQNAIMKNEISKRDGHEIIIASDDVIAEYKKILAPIESNWLKEMSGKGLDGDAVLNRAREIITAVEG